MNYAIFRSEPIMTTNDLAQIESHNQREKKAYKSNPDIRIEDSYKNIQLVPLNYKYVKRFYELTKEYEKQHNEKMKTERKERQRTYTQIVNHSRNCVADELLFTASPKFFDNMSEEDIMKWANTCMEFVYNDLGYTKEQTLKDGQYLKKQYIRDKIHLSQLQDKYHERLVDAGFDLERGIKGNNREHLKTKELKKTTQYYESKIQIINKNLDEAMNDFNEKMKTTKNTIFDKEYVKVKKETFYSMNKVIKETKKVVEFQPKIEQLFNKVNTFIKSYQTLEKENSNLKREVKSLVTRNQNLTAKNNKLKNYIDAILEAIKKFFRKILHFGNEYAKNETTIEVKEYYDYGDFQQQDIIDIAKGTTKEDELFDYAYIPDYHKTNDKEDYEMSL